ncbi:MAG: type IX secretion system sortase PorU [Tannerellaceae bacterium]|jgi:hypothetical protein|nr:type IX secretion system sortase PorU [Tannerellaceae bacterium]
MARFIVNTFLILFYCHALTLAAGTDSYAPSSALGSGKWVKIQIENTGVYKITDDDLRKMGFADPSRVSVRGYGGWALDEDFSRPYVDDLPQVAVYRGSNYLIFYGRGPVKWEYTSANTFVHTNNPYSTYGYYFLTDSGAREMETVPSISSGAHMPISTYDEYRLFEEDMFSVNKSGRELFGRSFAGGGSYTPSTTAFTIPGITGEEGKVTMRFIARPRSTAGHVTLTIDGAELIGADIPAVDIGDTYNKGIAVTQTVAWEGDKSEAPRVTVSYNKVGDENVHLDYIRLHVKRALQVYGACTFFRSIASRNNVARFTVRNADASTLVFDVTDGINPKVIEAELEGGELSFTVPAGELREFVALRSSEALGGWKSVGEVRNQNLHALSQTDMVVIAPDALRGQAERLAARHRTADALTVAVLSPTEIYNEFSSGTPDATAYRRLMKMLYDRAASDRDRPKYLLLFGDGAFDNRLLTTAWKNTPSANMLLTYQSENSLNEYSYVTDDYFGALGDTPFTTAAIQLGIGRIPVRTVEEATMIVDKILGYMDNTLTGAWKNRVCFLADDGSSSDRPPYSSEHMSYADRLGERVGAEHPEFMVSKLFFDAYKKTDSRYPDVKRNVLKALTDGLLVINYTGHGSTEKLSDEDVINATDIAQFTYPRLPLWITATCDFTRFDDTSTSAGESVFLQRSGGIAMFTTTRVVYSNNNFALNDLLIHELFSREGGGRLALGDVIRRTKAGLTDNNKLNFILIGDPAMKLAYPDYRIRVTAINGEAVGADDIVPARALERMTVRGDILSSDGITPSPGFSGQLSATVFDSRQTIRTLDNNHTGDTLSFTDYPYTIYTGSDIVKDGSFEFTFTVPKDISYSGDFGVINLYAASDSAHLEAQGYFGGLLIGGSSDSPERDSIGPEIRQVFLNTPSFRDGDIVNATPLLVARIWDKSGVNVGGSGIGHDITLSVDNLPASQYNLNAYYRLLPGEEGGGEGEVTFPIPTLSPGVHTAVLKAWDVANNPSQDTISFEVAGGIRPVISKVIASPLPSRTGITFLIYHDRPESTLNVSISIYDMTGRLCRKIETSGASGIDAPYAVDWDLRNGRGERLLPGIYAYRAAIREAGGREAAGSGKLLIAAQ